MTTISPAVARASMDSGVARKHVDLKVYPEQLKMRMGF
jgi:hypothetical protein